jgi:hypothetical protein
MRKSSYIKLDERCWVSSSAGVLRGALWLRPEMPSGSDPLVAKKAYYTFCLSAGILGAQYGVDRPATGFMVILTLAYPG